MEEGKRITVRLGGQALTDALTQRAEEAGVKESEIVRRALRLYLLDQEGVKASGVFEEMTKELKEFRAKFARIGGNLNQLAFYLNMNDTLDEGDLAKNHSGLQSEFGELAKLLKSITREFNSLRG